MSMTRGAIRGRKTMQETAHETRREDAYMAAQKKKGAGRWTHKQPCRTPEAAAGTDRRLSPSGKGPL